MKRMGKISSIVVMVLLCIALSSQVFAAGFTDVNNHWASQYIDWAAKNNVVEGYGDGTFKPEGTITRAEFFKMINRLSGFKDKGEIHFSDVKSTDWYYNEVAIGVKEGYITDSTGKIYPGDPLTRDEAARIMASVYQLKDVSSSANRFIDVSKITYRGAVGALVDKKVLNGYPDSSFRPQGSITRGELTKILYTSVHNMGLPQLVRVKKEVPVNNKFCPSMGDLAYAVSRGDSVLGERGKYNYTTAEYDELTTAIRAGKIMLDKTGGYYGSYGTSSRTFNTYSDLYEYYRNLGYSRTQIDTIWETRTNNGNGSYTVVDRYYSGYNDYSYRQARYTNFEDFYRAYGADFNYNRIDALKAWNNGNYYYYNGTCPYSEYQINDAVNRINRAITAFTDNYSRGSHRVTVNNGSTDAYYADSGTKVTVRPYTGYAHVYSPDVYLNPDGFGTFWFIMPDKDVTITFSTVPVKYTITVKDGEARVGEKVVTEGTPGTEVTIVANVPEGKVFKEWSITGATSQELGVGDEDLEKAPLKITFRPTAPGKTITITAIFEDKTLSEPNHQDALKNPEITVDGQTATPENVLAELKKNFPNTQLSVENSEPESVTVPLEWKDAIKDDSGNWTAKFSYTIPQGYKDAGQVKEFTTASFTPKTTPAAK